MAVRDVDVLIVGAGPVGLLLALQLTRMGISVHIIDKRDKADPDFPMFGRAVGLFTRTLEMLDQLDLLDDMGQLGVFVSITASWKDGQRANGGYARHFNPPGTFFGGMMNLRLKYSEDIFRRRLSELGVEVAAPSSLLSLDISDEPSGQYKVHASCSSPNNGDALQIRSKYIIGSDGNSSAVREMAGIPFVGSDTEDNWVRIDGVVKTDMPESRVGGGSVLSSTHGNVLWVAIDHGATRIGYALTPALYAKYGKDMTKDQMIYEANQAIAPFKVEFLQVDWYTVYSVKQRVAEDFLARGCVLLAGDAAHQHSSGSAQGMNTGVHDAVCLAWRLAGYLKGWYNAEVLETYATERHAVAARLIELDKMSSALISGHKPEQYKDSPLSIRELFDNYAKTESDFILGLGVHYGKNILNPATVPYLLNVEPGHRPPDTKVIKPGPKFEVRLQQLCKINGKFKILLFIGDKNSQACEFQRRSKDSFSKIAGNRFCDIVTIIAAYRDRVDEYLGFEHFGFAVWDPQLDAHWEYDINPEVGVAVVLRPDGIFALSARIDEEGVAAVEKYLDALTPKPFVNGITNGVGKL